MLTSTQKNTIMMAHDSHTMLTILTHKVQAGQELSEDDLKALPTLMSYAGAVLKQLLDGMTEPDGKTSPDKEPEPKKQDEKVREGEVED